MQELNLTPSQYIILFIIALLLLIGGLYRFYHASDTIELPEEEEPSLSVNPHYGAYIQSQGRYYN